MKQIKLHKLLRIFFPLSFLFLVSSCLGINMDIALNQDGSGIVTLEYKISKSLDSLGMLDGNERWNTIPAGRADFERTLDRLPDMKLLSFSSKEDETNLTNTVKMEFSTLQGLLAFLDASGRRSSFSGDARSGSMVLTLSEGAKNKSASLNQLVAAICEGYSVRMSMSFPGEGSLAVSDIQGKPLTAIPGSEINSKGKTVSCSFPLYQILSSGEGINVEFRW